MAGHSREDRPNLVSIGSPACDGAENRQWHPLPPGCGHRLAVGGAWSEGRLSARARDDTAAGRLLKAAANPRGMQGYNVGR
jgi:gamma-glutamyltranspeptidase / glutathione hydrolase